MVFSERYRVLARYGILLPAAYLKRISCSRGLRWYSSGIPKTLCSVSAAYRGSSSCPAPEPRSIFCREEYSVRYNPSLSITRRNLLPIIIQCPINSKHTQFPPSIAATKSARRQFNTHPHKCKSPLRGHFPIKSSSLNQSPGTQRLRKCGHQYQHKCGHQKNYRTPLCLTSLARRSLPLFILPFHLFLFLSIDYLLGAAPAACPRGTAPAAHPQLATQVAARKNADPLSNCRNHKKGSNMR